MKPKSLDRTLHKTLNLKLQQTSHLLSPSTSPRRFKSILRSKSSPNLKTMKKVTFLTQDAEFHRDYKNEEPTTTSSKAKRLVLEDILGPILLATNVFGTNERWAVGSGVKEYLMLNPLAVGPEAQDVKAVETMSKITEQFDRSVKLNET